MISVETAEPRKSSSLRLTGRLVWNDELTVRIYSPVIGRVTSASATVGQTIIRGDKLAQLLSPDFGQIQADSRKSKSSLLLAERTLARVRELFEHGAAPKKELDIAEQGHSEAQAERERSLARLTLYGEDDAVVDQLFSLKSPIAGVVVEKNINAGQEVRPDQMLANAQNLVLPLFVVSDPKNLWLSLDVTEQEMGRLRVGEMVHFTTRAFPERVFEARVESIGDSLDPNTRSVRVRASVSNPEKLLKAEMYVTADVLTEADSEVTQGVEISGKAIVSIHNQSSVLVEESTGRFVCRSVKMGTERQGRVTLLEGVNPGERVVTTGAILLLAQLIQSDAQ